MSKNVENKVISFSRKATSSFVVSVSLSSNLHGTTQLSIEYIQGVVEK